MITLQDIVDSLVDLKLDPKQVFLKVGSLFVIDYKLINEDGMVFLSLIEDDIEEEAVCIQELCDYVEEDFYGIQVPLHSFESFTIDSSIVSLN